MGTSAHAHPDLTPVCTPCESLSECLGLTAGFSQYTWQWREMLPSLERCLLIVLQLSAGWPC